MNKGFSTVEILIAFALLIIALSGILIVVFGNDSFALDSELNSKALFFAEEALNDARAQAAGANFTKFFGIAPYPDDEGYHATTTVMVKDLTPCKKELTSLVSWEPTPLRDQFVRLVSQIVSIDELEALGDDCADEPTDEWEDPSVLDFDPKVVGEGTDVDLDGDFVYLTTQHSDIKSSDFWIFNVADPLNPALVADLNTDGDDSKGPNRDFGLRAVDVAGGYAYVANASSTKSASSDELLVIDVSAPDDPEVVGRAQLDIEPNCPHFCPGGAFSVYYRSNRVYVGTHRLTGREFTVIDVSNPQTPVVMGAIEINHNVNRIFVRDDYAFLATSDDTGEMIIVNVATPSSMTVVGKFNAGDSKANDEDGMSIYVLGNKAFLGRGKITTSENNFHVINVSNPSTPSLIGEATVPLTSNSDIVDFVVSGPLVFMATTGETGEFQIWDISEPSNPKPRGCDVSYPENASGLDFDGSKIAVSNHANDALRLIINDPDNNSCK